MDYLVLAYYFFTPIEDPQKEVKKHHNFFKGRDATGRIYLSHEGINGQMSASLEDAEAYIQWFRSDPRFAGVEFKIHRYPEQVFPRMTVKVRKQLVAVDAQVDLSVRGESVSPEVWKQMLAERDADTLVLDVRNHYEWKIGHFEGSELPALEQFREFPDYAKRLKEERDPKKTKVMMCCTGGIRCELFSALLKKEGFEHVYQLQGGIIKYGLEVGSDFWRGKLFVFDDRLAVPLNDQVEAEVISHCHFCGEPSDMYYNCANMDCNELFLSCTSCAEKNKGCCTTTCQSEPRVRAFEKTDKRPKPFRKQSFLESCCLSTRAKED